ncbi:trypsin-like cysteine/serine peptidase domain-containing protein [Kickxella alabastrina]|uniref:trypsin-like cysteine/serine peptidase domain-containing protein n=1 Tax=Kickxella alabastrina TaxID=61397 RepID=UPI0022206782|nr:trypsin-like cysteine/serine peptidase domain-containing protein [Kickxella alabastrina]KAI7821281.1 trypsin-like cysteine/serine peptidase domain-containing protein [Kickxella alabastrina]
MGRRIGFGSLLLCALASIGTVSADVDRIIGGTAASTDMFPFIVHLFKDGNAFCGGTLIDSEWVITAAHCVAEGNRDIGAGAFTTSDPSSFKIGYGTNGGSLSNSVSVESITVNAGFDPVWYTSDIALLKIKSSNDLVQKTKIIAISNANVSAGQTVITAGWGQFSNSSPAQSSQLMYAGLVTGDEDTCKVGASDWNGQNGRYVCTSYSTAPNIGTCFGDSGGPLLMNSGSGYTLLGLVSFDVNTKDSSNTRCAQDGNVSYFTRVSSYLSFISSTTGISDKTLLGMGSPLTHSNGDSSSDGDKDVSSSTADSSSGKSSSSTSDKKDDSKTDDKKDDDEDKEEDKDEDKDEDKEEGEDKDKEDEGNDNKKDEGNDDKKGETTSSSSGTSSGAKATDKSMSNADKSTKPANSSEESDDDEELSDVSEDDNGDKKDDKKDDKKKSTTTSKKNSSVDDSYSSSASTIGASFFGAAFVLMVSLF